MRCSLETIVAAITRFSSKKYGVGERSRVMDDSRANTFFHSWQKSRKEGFLLVLLLFSTILSFAHNINYALESATPGNVAWFYLTLGFSHIIPEGLDHILFVVALCLISTQLKTIIWQATAFTIAHSITLALSMKNIIIAPGEIVEPVIAVSIVFVAVENMLIQKIKAWRIVVVFLFGLIHGLGFASALNEIGLPRNRFFTSILSFNIGVELGQIAVILITFILLIIPFHNKTFYRKYIVYPLSAIIAALAAFWTIERVFFHA